MKGLIIVGVVLAVYFILTLIFYCRATHNEKIENMTKKERKAYFKAKKEQEERWFRAYVMYSLFRLHF